MEELAEVVSITSYEIVLESQIKSTCNSCSQSKNCASGQVAKAIPQKKLTFKLPNEQSIFATKKLASLAVGDCVILSLAEGNVLHSAMQVYLLPILGLFVFSFMGQQLLENGLINHELLALMLGVFGGYIGFLLARYWQNKPANQKKLQPKIVRILPKPLVINNEGNTSQG